MMLTAPITINPEKLKPALGSWPGSILTCLPHLVQTSCSMRTQTHSFWGKLSAKHISIPSIPHLVLTSCSMRTQTHSTRGRDYQQSYLHHFTVSHIWCRPLVQWELKPPVPLPLPIQPGAGYRQLGLHRINFITQQHFLGGFLTQWELKQDVSSLYFPSRKEPCARIVYQQGKPRNQNKYQLGGWTGTADLI